MTKKQRLTAQVVAIMTILAVILGMVAPFLSLK
jgi:hypothetical protein